MNLDFIVKLVGLGAVGVAALALWFWREAFNKLVDAEKEKPLSGAHEQLKAYRFLALGALIIAALVQLVEHFKPPPSAHEVILNFVPDELSDKALFPAVSKNGISSKAADKGMFKFVVNGNSNFAVNVLGLRDRLEFLSRNNLELRRQLEKTSGRPAEVGPDTEF